jgi:hypothetical protein
MILGPSSVEGSEAIVSELGWTTDTVPKAVPGHNDPLTQVGP